MHRRWIAFAFAVTLVLLAAVPAQAGLLSKRYQFKNDVILEVGEPTGDGLRLDTVRFRLPPRVDGRVMRTGGQVRVLVAVSNTSEESRRAGLAVALFDADDRLVGVASGGNNLAPIKAGRQRRFELVFDGVNAEAHGSSVFHISLETKP